MIPALGAAPLDLEAVRRRFPAFSEPSLRDTVYCENAGGSYPCAPVVDRLGEFYRRLKVQPYYPAAASSEAGRWMDESHARLAAYLGVSADEVHFGPSTTQNTYVLAQALRPSLTTGDEIIVTRQEHEANAGAWWRLERDGVRLRAWDPDPATGILDPAKLDDLLGSRTRVVAFTHCSNIVGHVNPVRELCARARAAGALTVVDGVAMAPHGLPDVGTLGADLYLFSLYKTYGPHQGLMVVQPAAMKRMENQGHFFHADLPAKRLVPAGPDHAQVAAAGGVAEYMDWLDAHHGGAGDASGRPARVRERIRSAERVLIAPLLEFLSERAGVRLLGPADPKDRVPTVSCVPTRITPRNACTQLAERGIHCGAGHFYAVRLLEAMGVDPDLGALRLSLVHYNTPDEVARIIRALDEVLG